jgi:hypothetical protein
MKQLIESASTEPARPTSNRFKSAFNKLLLSDQWKPAQFESGEVKFPALPGCSYLDWQDAALINVSDWPVETQARFLQAHYFGTFLGDEKGMLLSVLDP